MATTTTVGDVLALQRSAQRQLLIGEAWADAASGETLPCIDPSTGREISEIAAGAAEDVDRAMGAARAALEGPWRALGLHSLEEYANVKTVWINAT